jgi:hypothetical protein
VVVLEVLCSRSVQWRTTDWWMALQVGPGRRGGHRSGKEQSSVPFFGFGVCTFDTTHVLTQSSSSFEISHRKTFGQWKSVMVRAHIHHAI